MLRKLAAGTTLLVDRYAYSGAAYTAAKGLSLAWSCHADVGLPQPDRVYYLAAADHGLLHARADYGSERYEHADFQMRVARCYERMFDAQTWLVIDLMNVAESRCSESTRRDQPTRSTPT